jgi:hypothetical protein
MAIPLPWKIQYIKVISAPGQERPCTMDNDQQDLPKIFRCKTELKKSLNAQNFILHDHCMI